MVVPVPKRATVDVASVSAGYRGTQQETGHPLRVPGLVRCAYGMVMTNQSQLIGPGVTART